MMQRDAITAYTCVCVCLCALVTACSDSPPERSAHQAGDGIKSRRAPRVQRYTMRRGFVATRASITRTCQPRLRVSHVAKHLYPRGAVPRKALTTTPWPMRSLTPQGCLDVQGRYGTGVSTMHGGSRVDTGCSVSYVYHRHCVVISRVVPVPRGCHNGQ